ncbi:MAG: hypothetical protein Q4G03_04295 [Planctomycetia bacterium]|nr:hypothetical protein [Planctomycetia bacterium]
MNSRYRLYLHTLVSLFFLTSSAFAQESASDVDADKTRDGVVRLEASGAPFLSQEWLRDFQTPPRVYRPLQIVHGSDMSNPKTVEYYRDECGLGGLVVNVGGAEYIRSAENWARFVKGVQNIVDAQMRVWIYDEDGYPSLGAGGVVLEGHPELGALELAYDPEHDPPYYVRDCYEFTHSSNNVFKARRYPNPLNPAATQRFIDVTHRRYREELGDLYQKVEAFFTDEPAMMAANLGVIQEEDIRSRVPYVDPIDPEKKMLPVVSWCDDLPERYFEKYNESLEDALPSLFAGDSPEDRKARRQFWTLLGQLDCQRYYAQIQDFCHETPNGPVASGHTLYEENILMQVPLDGNKLEVLKRFDIPGMDMLNSDPIAYYYGNWAAAAFPLTAAILTGQRRMMTEISDFSQLVAGERKPATLELMQATAGWQSASGATDYMLYYRVDGADYRNEKTHAAYCEYVGRLNATLMDAQPVRKVLLYYPIEELQEEFRPVADKIGVNNQSQRVREIVESFNIIGAGLSRVQTSFCLADRSTLANLTKTPTDPEEAARIQGLFSAVIFPAGSQKIQYDWVDPDFKEYWTSSEEPLQLWEDVARAFADVTGPRLTPTPSYPSFVEGAFERDGRLVFVVVNVVPEEYETDMTLTGIPSDQKFDAANWIQLDPESGAMTDLPAKDGVIHVKMKGRQTLIFVSPQLQR